MTEDNRVIDEFSQVRLTHGTLEEMQRYNATLIRWIMRTAGSAEEMQESGRIDKMPKLRRCEGARKSTFELRRSLWQATHKPFASDDMPQLWSQIEQLLELVEKTL